MKSCHMGVRPLPNWISRGGGSHDGDTTFWWMVDPGEAAEVHLPLSAGDDPKKKYWYYFKDISGRAATCPVVIRSADGKELTTLFQTNQIVSFVYTVENSRWVLMKDHRGG